MSPSWAVLLTVQAAANRIGCHPQTIRRHIKDGRLQVFKFGGKRYVLASELDSIGPADQATPGCDGSTHS
jgi:excisionase family DNA binding protein